MEPARRAPIGGSHPFMSGLINNINKNWVTVNISDGKCLIIEKILNEKNKNILNMVKLGDRLFTHPEKLIIAKSIRSKFNSSGLKK